MGSLAGWLGCENTSLVPYSGGYRRLFHLHIGHGYLLGTPNAYPNTSRPPHSSYVCINM